MKCSFRADCQHEAVVAPLVSGIMVTDKGELSKCRIGWGHPLCNDHRDRIVDPPSPLTQTVTEDLLILAITMAWGAPPPGRAAYTVSWVAIDDHGLPASASCSVATCQGKGKFRGMRIDEDGDVIPAVCGALCSEHRDDATEKIEGGKDIIWAEIILF